MKRIILLAALLLLTVSLGVGCNGAQLEDPASNPLPGSGMENPGINDDIDANYALDIIIPEREQPPSIPVDDPVWDPVFDSLEDDLPCINEGCMTFQVKTYDPEERIVTFKVTFYNLNADNAENLTIFMYLTDVANGIYPVDADGIWKIEEFDVDEYPFFTFSHESLEGSQVPDQMYLYFEREISFQLDYGADFYVGYTLVPFEDVHGLSNHVIPTPLPRQQDIDDGYDEDGRTGGGSTPPPNGSETPGGTPDEDSPGEDIAPGVAPPVRNPNG